MATGRTTKRDYEVWEALGKGAVWVTLTDDGGREMHRQIGGPGSGVARLRIKVADREAMQASERRGRGFFIGPPKRPAQLRLRRASMVGVVSEQAGPSASSVSWRQSWQWR